MTRLMYDGINSLAAGIARQFPNAAMIAYYLNGAYAWTQAQRDLFPHAGHVTITVTASANAGDVLDVETGDATPDQAEGWITMRKAAGLYRPTLYGSLDTVPALRIGTVKWVLGRDWDLWVAHYTGQPHVAYPGAAATQYESTPGYDASEVHDPLWPHRQPPAPPGSPSAPKWPAGVVLREGDTGPAVRVLQQALSGTGLQGVRGIAVDGVFGVQTETALRNFQSRYDIGVDGVAGPQTRAALGV